VTTALLEGAGVVIPTLPAAGTVTFTVTATVTASSGTVTNTATVTAPAGMNDPNSGNNAASDIDTVVQQALTASLNKAFSPTTIATGGTTTLTFTLTNPAPNNPAQTVSFIDNLPAGLQVAAAPNLQSNCTGVVATHPAGGQTITVTSATVPASTATPGLCTISVDVTNAPQQSGSCPNASFTNASGNISGAVNLTNAVTPSCVSVTTRIAAPPPNIPTVGVHALLALMLLLAAAGAICVRRGRR
jgi:uncharacterized repeat protein (TIGR01451 family)